MRSLALAAATLTLLAAPAKAQGLDDVAQALRQGGLSAQAGEGTINGVTFPAYVVQSETQTLAEAVETVKASLKGPDGKARFTVTQDLAQQGVVLIAWNMRSEQCPTCAPASKERLQEMFENATVLTILPLPTGGTLSIASGAGAILRAQRGKGSYQGSVAKGVVKGWRIDLQSSFTFGRGAQHTHTAWSPKSKVEIESSLRLALEKEGFEKGSGRAGDVGEVARDEAQYFSRGSTIVGYDVRTDPVGGSVINLYETIAPKTP